MFKNAENELSIAFPFLGNGNLEEREFWHSYLFYWWCLKHKWTDWFATEVHTYNKLCRYLLMWQMRNKILEIHMNRFVTISSWNYVKTHCWYRFQCLGKGLIGTSVMEKKHSRSASISSENSSSFEVTSGKTISVFYRTVTYGPPCILVEMPTT